MMTTASIYPSMIVLNKARASMIVDNLGRNDNLRMRAALAAQRAMRTRLAGHLAEGADA